MINNILDLKDKKILFELGKNARLSNIQLGKKVGLSKEVVKYRIDNLTKKGVIIRFHTVVNYFKLGLVKFKLYIRFTNASREKFEEIAEYFHKHKKTEWVALTTGRWDLISGFIVNNVNEFDDELQIILNKFSKYIQEKAVTTTLYLAHQTREFSKKISKKTSEIVYHTSKDKQESIDKTDWGILKLIVNNARMSLVEISKQLNTTPRIVQYRIKEMKKKEIILAYKVHLEPRKMGKIFCKAILYLSNMSKERLSEFIKYTSSMEGVIWPQRVLGNWDFELDLELPNYDAFQDTLIKLKERFPDIIKNHDFCIVSKEYKLDLL